MFKKQGEKWGTTYFTGRLWLLLIWTAVFLGYLVRFLVLGNTKLNGYEVVSDEETYTATSRIIQTVVPILAAFVTFWLVIDEKQHKEVQPNDDDSFLGLRPLGLCIFFTLLGHGVVWLFILFWLDAESLAAAGSGSFNKRVNWIFYIMFAMQTVLTVPCSFMLKRKVVMPDPHSSHLPSAPLPNEPPKKEPRKRGQRNSSTTSPSSTSQE